MRRCQELGVPYPGADSSVKMDAEVPKGRGIGEKLRFGSSQHPAVSSGKGGVGNLLCVNVAVSLRWMARAWFDGCGVMVQCSHHAWRQQCATGCRRHKLVPIEAHGIKYVHGFPATWRQAENVRADLARPRQTVSF